jgi:dTDP-glucose 4,6-dehydratase
MTKQVLVTGAGGFIGSHLTEELVKTGHNVRAMIRYNCQNRWGWLEMVPKEILENLEIFAADIRDPFVVRRAVSNCDTVYHLAALVPIPYSYVAPASYVETNVMGTLNVLQACMDEGVSRLIHTSTSETYGTAQYVPIDEGHPLVGQSPYSASKIAAEKLVESYHLSFGLPVSTIRPFNTFGPRQSLRAIIPTIISQALSDVNTILLGSLSPVRDFVYVKDTVQGFIRLAASSNSIGEVINIGRGEGITIGELAQLILDISGSKLSIEFDNQRLRPEKSEIMELVCDNTKAHEILSWQPKYSLEKGLEETIEWMRANVHDYKPWTYNM